MIDAKGIEKVIPHRGAMRLVDEIREYRSIGTNRMFYRVGAFGRQ